MKRMGREEGRGKMEGEGRGVKERKRGEERGRCEGRGDKTKEDVRGEVLCLQTST